MKIHDIIKETIKEELGMDNLRFKHTLNKNINYYNYQPITNDLDYDITESEITVDWGIKFNVKNFGIGNMTITINGISGVFNLVGYNKQTDVIENETIVNINDYEWKFLTENDTIQNNMPFYINELMFDFKNRTCTIVF